MRTWTMIVYERYSINRFYHVLLTVVQREKNSIFKIIHKLQFQINCKMLAYDYSLSLCLFFGRY